MGLEQVFWDMYNPEWFESYNTKVTYYRDGTCKLFRSTSDIWKFTEEGKKELSEDFKYRLKKKLGEFETNTSVQQKKEDNIERSIRRSRKEIKDLLLNNASDSSLFVTLTNGNRTGDEIFDNTSFKKNVLKRLNNLKRTLNFDYLLVPELHEDKKYIHYHGIINGDIGHLTPAVNPKTGELIEENGKQIYNIDKLSGLGFTTASYVEDYKKACTYISKYITKETIQLKGFRRYYYSSGMKKPDKADMSLSEHDFNLMCNKVYRTPNGSLGFSKYVFDEDLQK